MTSFKKSLTKEQALQKLRHFCAYQERCHSDLVSKLFDWGVLKKEHDEIVATLIEEQYVNEERYAKAFAGGHFRLKQWGRHKISHELKLRKISDYCIKSGLSEIDEEDYLATLHKLFRQKWESLLGEKNRFVKMKKTADFLAQKGYEKDLVNQLFKNI